MKIKHLATLYLIITVFASCSDNNSEKWNPEDKKNSGIGIILTPNTSLRIDPLIFSSRIDQMKKGEAVEILDRSKERKYIGKTRDYWYKIKLSNGITGWTFGAHINILDKSSKKDVNRYLEEFWAKEQKTLSKELRGKWWSVNRFGDFTSHSLEIYEDGKYKSYYKKSKTKIEGEYTFDFNDNLILFSKGTSFKNNLKFYKRGSIYVLAKETEKREIIFKKINIDPESDGELKEKKDKEKENKAAKDKGKDGSKTQ